MSPNDSANSQGSGQSNLLSPKDISPEQNLNWIYKSSKEQLIQACEKLAIDYDNRSVCEIRKLISQTMKNKRQNVSTENLIKTIQDSQELEEQDILVANSTHNTPQMKKTVDSHTEMDSALANSSSQKFSQPPIHEGVSFPQLRDLHSIAKSWNMMYDGGENLHSFLSAVEGRAEHLGIAKDKLLPLLPYFLTNSAQQWFEIQAAEIHTWEEFRSQITQFFLPTRGLVHFENLYYSRRQQQNEQARDYILDVLAIARQHPQLKNKCHLDKLYDGLLPHYKYTIKRAGFKTVGDFTSQCNEFEQLRRDECNLYETNIHKPANLPRPNSGSQQNTYRQEFSSENRRNNGRFFNRPPHQGGNNVAHPPHTSNSLHPQRKAQTKSLAK